MVFNRSSISGDSAMDLLLRSTTANLVRQSDLCNCVLILLISVLSWLSCRLLVIGSVVKSKKHKNMEGT